MPVPSRTFISGLRQQRPAPDLVEKLKRGFPRLGAASPVMELCLEDGGFPHDLDCGGFALGDRRMLRLANRPIAEVQQRLLRLGLAHVPGGEAALAHHPAGSAVIATYQRTGRVRHFALGYLDDSSVLERTWYSKFGLGYPVLLHTINEINHADYGEVGGVFVCAPSRCGVPLWCAA